MAATTAAVEGLDRTLVPKGLRDIQFINHLKRKLAQRYLVTAGNPAANYDLRTCAYHDNEGRRAKLVKTAARISAEIGQHIQETVLKPRCLALCDQMLTKLPRELRDQIYGHLLHDSTIDISALDQIVDSGMVGTAIFLLKQEFYGHITSPAAENKCVRAEFASAWYHSATFKFHNTAYLSRFANFNWKVSGHDVRQLIRSFEVALYITPDQQLGSLVCQLQHVALLPKGTRGTLVLVVEALTKEFEEGSWPPYFHLHSGIRAVVDHLSMMFAELQTLLSEGHNLSLDISGYQKFRIKSDELTVEHWIDNALGGQRVR